MQDIFINDYRYKRIDFWLKNDYFALPLMRETEREREREKERKSE